MPQSTSLIDLDALPAEVAQRVRWVLDEARGDFDRDVWMKAVCETGTDAEIIAAGEKEYPSAPIGLSTWYSEPWLEQRTIFNRVHAARYPVFMRGGRNVLIRRHCRTVGGSSPNGWAIMVFWRAVRIAKITALSPEEFRAATAPIYEKLHAKYYLTAAFERGVCWDVWGGPNMIGGQVTWLEGEPLRHVRALSAIAKKTETLDRKREMVRQQLMERLAQ